MTPPFPADRWDTLQVVVRDYRQVVLNVARFFGIERWEVRRIDGRRLRDHRVAGQPTACRWISVTGRHAAFAIELVQPVDGPTPFQHTLDTVGEGMHGLAFKVDDRAAAQRWLDVLADEGVATEQQGSLADAWDYHMLDTRALLAGIRLELRLPFADVAPADEVLQVDLARFGPALLPVQKMYHLGVVCADRHRTKATMARLFGIQSWIELEIESGRTISDTTYYGREVYHAYDNHVGRRGAISFELITPRTADNVYDDFFKQRGEGLQHVFPTICTREASDRALAQLRPLGMEIIQSGNIGGLLEYYYLDTRRYLPGITTEVVVPLREDWLEAMFPDRATAWTLMGD